MSKHLFRIFLFVAFALITPIVVSSDIPKSVVSRIEAAEKKIVDEYAIGPMSYSTATSFGIAVIEAELDREWNPKKPYRYSMVYFLLTVKFSLAIDIWEYRHDMRVQSDVENEGKCGREPYGSFIRALMEDHFEAKFDEYWIDIRSFDVQEEYEAKRLTKWSSENKRLLDGFKQKSEKDKMSIFAQMRDDLARGISAWHSVHKKDVLEWPLCQISATEFIRRACSD